MHWFKSPAKINRFLYIKRKLPNGYHEIVTVFEKIAFCDSIGIEVKEDNRNNIHIDGPEWLSSGPDNLIYKAVEAFKRASGLDFSVEVKLQKMIPAGAGLGGGSSNCGTTLKALNKILGEPVRQRDLFTLASSIGADCPFFVSDWIGALGTGTGAELQQFPIDSNWYLLVLPDFSVSTRWAYENFKLTRQDVETIFEPRKVQSHYEWVNDLEKTVCAKYPAISRIKSTLEEAGASKSLMSGSGSTVFGVFENKAKALEAQTYVSERTGYKCLVTKTLDHCEKL